MEFSQLEEDAQQKARKYVANMLHTPDKLEKVSQMKWNVTRKKASVEAMLNDAPEINNLISRLHTKINSQGNYLVCFIRNWRH